MEASTFRAKFNKETIFRIIGESETLKGLPFWVAAVISGIVAVIYAHLFRFAEVRFLDFYKSYPAYIFILTPFGFLLSWYLGNRFAPNAKGSGIPQVLALIDMSQGKTIAKSEVRKLISWPITVIKILSSLVIVICGGAVGREGPTIQISAYIFDSIGDKFGKLWKQPSQDVFFITGGAAGIAAAFNTPLGGIVYAIEELSRSHFNRFKTSLITGVIISGIIAQTLAGPYLFIGVPRLSPYSTKVLGFAILIGLVGGFAGAMFGQALWAVAKFRQKLKTYSQFALVSIFSGLVLAAMIYFINVDSATSGKELIKQMMFTGKLSSLTTVALRFFSPVVTYLNGSPGGIFSPALSAGASIGGWVADLFYADHRNTCIILGMIAFLSAFTGAPFTSFVLVLEMTDRHSILFSMMVTALISYMVGQAISHHPFYEMAREFFLPPVPKNSDEPPK